MVSGSSPLLSPLINPRVRALLFFIERSRLGPQNLQKNSWDCMLMAWLESYAECSTSQDGLGDGLSHWLDAPEGLGSWMMGGSGDSSTQIVWKLVAQSNCVTPWTVACQAPLSMGFSRKGYLEWVAIPFSRGSSQPRDRMQVFCIADRFLTIWVTREAHFVWTGSWRHVVLSKKSRCYYQREFQKNIYFCFIDYAKPLTVWITINCGTFWKRWEY